MSSTDQTTETETRHSWWVSSPSWDERNNYVPPHWEHSDEELVLRAIWDVTSKIIPNDLNGALPRASCWTSRLLRECYGDALASHASEIARIAGRIPAELRSSPVERLFYWDLDKHFALVAELEELHDSMLGDRLAPFEVREINLDNLAELVEIVESDRARQHVWAAFDRLSPQDRVDFAIEMEKMFSEGVI